LGNTGLVPTSYTYTYNLNFTFEVEKFNLKSSRPYLKSETLARWYNQRDDNDYLG